MDDSTEKAFQEGVPGYVKARRVTDKYESIIQEIAKSVLNKKLNAISDAMGACSLGPIMPCPPEREGVPSSYAGTGVYIALARCGRCYVMVYVYGDKKMKAVVSFYLNSGWQAYRIMDAAKAMPGMEKMLSYYFPVREVYAEERLREVSTEALAMALENLLDIWISFWGKVGGIKKLSSKK